MELQAFEVRFALPTTYSRQLATDNRPPLYLHLTRGVLERRKRSYDRNPSRTRKAFRLRSRKIDRGNLRGIRTFGRGEARVERKSARPFAESLRSIRKNRSDAPPVSARERSASHRRAVPKIRRRKIANRFGERLGRNHRHGRKGLFSPGRRGRRHPPDIFRLPCDRASLRRNVRFRFGLGRKGPARVLPRSRHAADEGDFRLQPEQSHGSLLRRRGNARVPRKGSAKHFGVRRRGVFGIREREGLSAARSAPFGVSEPDAQPHVQQNLRACRAADWIRLFERGSHPCAVESEAAFRRESRGPGRRGRRPFGRWTHFAHARNERPGNPRTHGRVFLPRFQGPPDAGELSLHPHRRKMFRPGEVPRKERHDCPPPQKFRPSGMDTRHGRKARGKRASRETRPKMERGFGCLKSRISSKSRSAPPKPRSASSCRTSNRSFRWNGNRTIRR